MLFGSPIASFYVQPAAGGDTALLVGVLKALIESQDIKQDFLSQHTTGSQKVLADAAAISWGDICQQSGVQRKDIEEMSRLIAAAQSAVFAWAMGLTHHEHGVENVLALSNVALATGNVGREGAGMMPIRGHSNVQGVSSVGFTPCLQKAVHATLEAKYGRAFPTASGYDTFSMMEAANRGKIDTLIALGGNLWGSSPDLDWTEGALNKIGTVVYLSTKLNPGHFHGCGKTTLILPVLARDEEPQATTQESLFNFVRLSDGGQPNVKGLMRSESEVICDLAERVLTDKPVDWSALRSHKEVRKLIAEVIPGWTDIGDIDETRREFVIGGRILHSPRFPTESGLAAMQPTPLPSLDDRSLRLITLRSEGQFNTVVYEESDFYRGIPHRYCVLVSQFDAARLGIADGQKVTVRGEAGSLDNIEVVVGDIAPGTVAMFFPEANLLLKGRVDKRSRTPAFKSAPVSIEKQAGEID